ncbi:septation protein SepH [Corynebacterium sp. H128]|uniref:septation protein SepH n=1 Tax=unclassified Corynebacterium TaxID=2624378 RepID=UPI0030AE8E1A
MRELKLVVEESTASSLVFRADGEDFFVEVTQDLQSLISGEQPAPVLEATTEEIVPAEPETVAEPVAAAQPAREVREIDPRLSAPLKMRPRDIQERIRAGASIAEVAAENDVTEARIEAFAHPVLQERARVADMAKRSHPVREDGPAKLTLWEVLATAFAARGNDLTASTWDAYKDPAGQWVVRVSWQTGLSDNVAEWSYHSHGMSNATAVARNAVAADLTDPDFGQPAVRTLSAVQRSQEPAEVEEVQEAEDEFLQHPDATEQPQKRRRKAVTPHWEDVLLGVRTNTKRPRS